MEMAPPSASETMTSPAVRVYLGKPSPFQGMLPPCARQALPVPGSFQSPCHCCFYHLAKRLQSPVRHQASGSVSLHLDGPPAACQCLPELRRGEQGGMAGPEFPTTPSHPICCCPCLPLRQCLCFLAGTRGRNMPREVYAKEHCLLGRF